jgi:hypothetical protein
MKNLLAILMIGGITMFTACGPSAEEEAKAKAEAEALTNELMETVDNATDAVDSVAGAATNAIDSVAKEGTEAVEAVKEMAK